VIRLTDHPEGVLIAVRAQAGASKSGLLGEHASALKLAVKAPPADGRANAALVELIRDLLGLKRSQVELHNGATVRNKTFLIRGVAKAELAAKITALFDG
jgi:uncharacterized protein (TIGR00251 family)